jgi:hypothetical protein
MKTMILAAIAALALSIGAANTLVAPYHTPAYNYQQNSWVIG